MPILHFPYFVVVNTAQESQLTGAIEIITFSIEVFYETEENEMMERKVKRYLAIQIWSPDTAKAISGNFSILNGCLLTARY